MNVDLMKKVVDDFDDGKDVVGTKLIKRWMHDEGSLKLWRASSNFIYVFRENDERKILRVTPDAERSIDLLLAEMDFTDHLRKKGILIPKPIPSYDQNKIETLITDFGTFHGVVFNFIEGDCIDDHNEFDETRFVEWGRILARIHEAALSFKPRSNRKRKTWEDDIEMAIGWLPQEEKELREKLQSIKEWIKSIPQDEFYGLLHYDVEPDNIIWTEKSYYIIDFDDAAYYPFVADLSFALEEIRKEEPDVEGEMLYKFIKGYTSVKSLPKDWEYQLEQFYTLMDIYKYARVIHAYENTEPKTDREWTQKMRERHKERMKETKKKLFDSWNLKSV